MKIATTLKDGQICQNFGNTKQFIVFEAKDDKIISSEVIDAIGGQETFAGQLVLSDVDVLICGSIEGESLYSLLSVGIRTYPGVAGDPKEAALEFLKGTMEFTPDKGCEHEHHHHDTKTDAECKGANCNGDCANCKL